MITNRAYVIGHLAADAKLDILKNHTPCVRFRVIVPRSPEHVGAKFMPYAGPDGRLRRDQVPDKLKQELNDELQVAGYGPRAALWAEGLSAGTCVAVDGWTEERRFFDKTVGRYRTNLEINAVHVIRVNVTGTGQAPANWVNVIGRLVKDPLFEVLHGAVPCLRLRLSVPRSARQVSAEASEPVSGSVSAVQPMAAPEMSRGSHSSRTATGACAAKKLVCTLTKKKAQAIVEQA